jgi:hypothetical protein
MDDIEGTVCSNCDRTIHKNDLVSQSRKYAENLVRTCSGSTSSNAEILLSILLVSAVINASIFAFFIANTSG